MADVDENQQKMVEPTADAFVDSSIIITIDCEKYYYLYVDMDAEHSFEFQNSFRTNGLGSVTELIDENENVVNRYRYTPFGEALYKEEAVFNPYQYTFRDFEEIPNVGRIAQQFQQTGRRYDNETGQYYYRARMYSPVQGRFLSQDPLGMVDGPNMYTYARNNPVLFRDPSGQQHWPPPYSYNGGASKWCPLGWHMATFGKTPGGGRRDPQPLFGEFSYIRRRVLGVNLYAGYKWSFTQEETSAIGMILGGVSGGLTIGLIAGLGALALGATVTGGILGAIAIAALYCYALNMGTAIRFLHQPMPFPWYPATWNYWCD